MAGLGNRYGLLIMPLLLWLGACAGSGQPLRKDRGATMAQEDAGLAKRLDALTPIQKAVTQQAATERPFTGAYWNVFAPGEYRCVVCGAPLFSSEAKFDAGCGWPSFRSPLPTAKIEERMDNSLGMERTEVRCAACGAHLGHVFLDGPKPLGTRYCINSASLEFIPQED